MSRPPSKDDDMQQRLAALAWHELQKQRMHRAQTTDWASMGIDDAELANPKNLKVELGPVLTEEQFKAHLKSTGVKNPTIVRTPKK